MGSLYRILTKEMNSNSLGFNHWFYGPCYIINDSTINNHPIQDIFYPRVDRGRGSRGDAERSADHIQYGLIVWSFWSQIVLFAQFILEHKLNPIKIKSNKNQIKSLIFTNLEFFALVCSPMLFEASSLDGVSTNQADECQLGYSGRLTDRIFRWLQPLSFRHFDFFITDLKWGLIFDFGICVLEYFTCNYFRRFWIF